MYAFNWKTAPLCERCTAMLRPVQHISLAVVPQVLVVSSILPHAKCHRVWRGSRLKFVKYNTFFLLTVVPYWLVSLFLFVWHRQLLSYRYRSHAIYDFYYWDYIPVKRSWCCRLKFLKFCHFKSNCWSLTVVFHVIFERIPQSTSN